MRIGFTSYPNPNLSYHRVAHHTATAVLAPAEKKNGKTVKTVGMARLSYRLLQHSADHQSLQLRARGARSVDGHALREVRNPVAADFHGLLLLPAGRLLHPLELDRTLFVEKKKKNSASASDSDSTSTSSTNKRIFVALTPHIFTVLLGFGFRPPSEDDRQNKKDARLTKRRHR